jgi:photosystem II stability/assembly factor-like uncharacterized protein
MRALAALALLAAAAAAAAPLLFHGHGHGLSFSADGATLLAPSDRGLAFYERGTWHEPEAEGESFSAFSASEKALYSSGHAHPDHAPRGLIRSTDGGRTWQVLARAGEADFPMLAAGFRSGALYVLRPGSGIELTRDEGRSWLRAQARGLEGEVHGLAAHPDDPALLAAASGSGLYVSRDAGATFRRLDRRGPVTAVAFDFDGRRLRYARALSSSLYESSLEGRERRTLALPRLEGDYVTSVAQNPKDARELAFATRRRAVYLTGDGGATWQRIWPES